MFFNLDVISCNGFLEVKFLAIFHCVFNKLMMLLLRIYHTVLNFLNLLTNKKLLNKCYAAWYGSCPGLKVLSPYSAEDARGLLKAAIKDPDPVVFLENEFLYGESFPISAEVLDSSFCLPIGKAKIELEGKDVTITAFSKMVGYALQSVEILSKEGISAEVINLRSIRPLDRDTINRSVRKTNRLVTVEEGYPHHGVGVEICASVIEENFGYLDAPVERIADVDVPMPYAANLDRMAVPQVEDIVRTTKRVCYRSVPKSASATWYRAIKKK
ncbi:hypothetical protein MKX01_018409 [Papaver californicum]|nr:hypothetical protein MKX01_018409 [Papaver californicum]